ncbi:hypothetical protein JCM10450v2_001412 [Rhodotorula kratochvilovae]
MLSTTLLALAGAALAVSALPSGGGKGGYGGYDDYGLGDSLVSASNFNEKEAEESVSLKELCYRNLYADAEAFDLRTDKEVAIKDSKGADVFLFAAVKKDINDVEFYYEEFCYKQTRVKEHNSKVSANSVVVGLKERGLDIGFGGFGLGGLRVDGGKGLGGEYGGFDSSSFLDGAWGDSSFLLGGGGGLGGGYGGIGGIGGGYGGVGGGFDDGSSLDLIL